MGRVTDHPERVDPFRSAGGAGAFGRLADAFYDRVLADDLLLPLFADPGEPHAERMALWLGQVLGGPPDHDARRVGLPTVIGVHTGLRIRDEQRVRWLEHMSAALDEVALPAGPRALWWSYLDPTSRLVERQSWAR